MDQKIKTGLGVGIILLIAFVLGALFLFQGKKEQSNPPSNISRPEPVACSQDIKDCPDGSQVSRRGPNCEFAPCSNAQIVGGPCSYEKVLGTCKIISVTQDDNVKFTFTSTSPLPTNDLAKNLNGQHSDAQYIFNAQNLPLKSEDIINCEASLITKGTCTPVIIRLVK